LPKACGKCRTLKRRVIHWKNYNNFMFISLKQID
jgi:hypothetical protein